MNKFKNIDFYFKAVISFIIIFLIQFIQISPSFGQSFDNNEDDISYHLFEGQFISNCFKDAGSIVTSPLRWEGNDWLITGVVIGTTVGLYALDTQTEKLAKNINGSSFTTAISNVATPFGDITYVIPTLGGVYLLGELIDDRKLRKTALLSLESLAITGTFVETLKLSFHRHRPNTGDPYNTFDGPSFSSSNLSFPSGHAAAAFSVLSVVAAEYSDVPIVPPVAYSIAALVGFSRFNDIQHWASDVFFGSALGFLVAKTIVHSHLGSDDEALAIYPIIDNEISGVLVKVRF
ncbi:MAG: phosphatase PAP2 family protein [Nitrospirae bacterium]|nr:phosphatase PAP2 family protein [Nitrospirota bacterium]